MIRECVNQTEGLPNSGRSARSFLKATLMRICIAALFSLVALPSIAQAQSGPSADTSAPSAVREGTLDEVVVTARRVSERLQDIPASVSAVGGDQVANFTSLNDLQSAVSGVTFKSFGPITVVGIRGFGNRSNTQGPNTAVGIFQDGVFIAPFLNALTSRIDVSRIEVAKGPQSTLYGRSTYAGAINIVTNDPTPVLSGYVDAGAGGSSAHSEGLWHVRAALSGALSDTLSARAFFLHEERDGYTYDLNTGFRGYGYDRNVGRLKLLWKPSDNLSVGLAGTVMRDNAPRGEVHTNDIAVPPLGGRTLFGSPLITPIFAAGPDIWSTNLIRPLPGRVNGQQGTADIRYQTPIGELASLTDYTHSDTFFSTSEPSTRNVVSTPTITDERRLSQEFRLSGKSGKFSYFGGLYYLNTDFNFGNSGNTLDLGAPFAQFFPGSVTYDLGNVSKILTPSVTKTKAYAAFAQLGTDLTDNLNLTVGLRQSRDDVSGTTESDTLLRSGVLVTPVPRVYRQKQFNSTTGSLNLSYRFNPDILAYASYARGDSPGGFNNGGAAAISFTPQKVNAFELGLKSELLDRHLRLNLALFNNNYKDLQFFQAIFLNGTNNQVTLNAAGARGRGVELDSTVVLSDNWKLGVQYTRQTSKITAYNIPAPPAPQVSFIGAALVRSPEHALNASLTYAHDIGSGKLQLVAEQSYTSSYNNDYQGVPAGTAYPAGQTRPGLTPGVTTSQVLGLFETPGYSVTNLNARYTMGPWELSGYVRNLTNHQYIVATATTDAFTYALETPGEPRTYELSVKYSF
jgi:iron complex outermembrane receptor protein